MKVFAELHVRRFAPLMAVLLLCACTGHPRAMSMPMPQEAPKPSLAETKETESAAWKALGSEAGRICGVSVTPPTRERAVEQSDCVTALVEKHVLPVAAFPDLLMESRSDARRLAVYYAGGKLTPEQYKSMAKARMDDYRQQWLVQAASQNIWSDAVRPVSAKQSLSAARKPRVARL